MILVPQPPSPLLPAILLDADLRCFFLLPHPQLGRQRAESMSPGQSPPVFRSPFARGGSGTPPHPSAVFSERDEDQTNDSSEPNETTGIVTRGPHRSAPSAMNYQSTVAAETTHGAWPRRNGSTPRSNTGRRRETAGGGGPEATHGHDHDHDKEAMAWWKTQLAKFGSIELENKGSVARDHLALGWFFFGFFCVPIPFPGARKR